MNKLTHAQCRTRALGTYLSSWDDTLSYDQVLEGLRTDNDAVCDTIDIAELYENCFFKDEVLAAYIADEYKSLCHWVGLPWPEVK